MELSCGLHQGLPVLQVLVQVVPGQLHADVLQLVVEAHHQLFVFSNAGDIVPDRHQLLLCLLQDQVGE